jgi:hypothetical protein
MHTVIHVKAITAGSREEKDICIDVRNRRIAIHDFMPCCYIIEVVISKPETKNRF